MNSKEDAEYRLNISSGFLKEAEEDFRQKRWRSCVGNSQMSLENAGKAVISLFKPVEKTHEPIRQIKELIERGLLNESDCPEISFDELVETFSALGEEEHFRSDYGDEAKKILPWDIYDEDFATKSIVAARGGFGLAKKIFLKKTEGG